MGATAHENTESAPAGEEFEDLSVQKLKEALLAKLAPHGGIEDMIVRKPTCATETCWARHPPLFASLAPSPISPPSCFPALARVRRVGPAPKHGCPPRRVCEECTHTRA